MEKQKLVGGLPKFGAEEVMSEVCEACQLRKQAKHPFPAQTTHVSSKPLEMIHSDVWTTKTESIGGCQYYMSFIDDHTRKVWVYFMKHKGEVFQHFLNFKAMVEKEKGVSIKCLRSDGGGEYFSNELSEYLKEHGIQRKYSCSYPPQHNGVAEWKNMHIVEITCAMLNEKNLPNYLWAEAVAIAVYIMNRTPTAAVHGMTPENKFTGKKPDVSHFRVFGCIAYMHVPEEKRSKLNPKVDKCIFIGYSLEQKGYRCFNPSTRKLQVSRDVVFDEMVSWYSPLKVVEDREARNGDVSSNVEQESQLISGPQESMSGSSNTPWKGRLRSSNIVHGSSQTSSKNSHVDGESSDSEKSEGEESRITSVTTLRARMANKALKTPDNNSGVRRSTQVKYPVQRLTYDGFVAHHYAYMVRVIREVEPTYFEQTIRNPKWDNAMDEKMVALDANATWELVALPEHKKAIRCKWVYKIKHNVDGSMSRYKARLVAKGYTQTYGIDHRRPIV